MKITAAQFALLADIYTRSGLTPQEAKTHRSATVNSLTRRGLVVLVAWTGLLVMTGAGLNAWDNPQAVRI